MAQEKELTLEEALAKIAEQEGEIANLNTRITDLEGEQAEATETISDLQEQLANAQAGQAISETVVVTHTAEDGSKEQYKVVAPKFQHKHVAYAAADLKKNPELVGELVAAKSGVLLKLEKPATGKGKKEASK